MMLIKGKCILPVVFCLFSEGFDVKFDPKCNSLICLQLLWSEKIMD